jgi:hypothetical protein
MNVLKAPKLSTNLVINLTSIGAMFSTQKLGNLFSLVGFSKYTAEHLPTLQTFDQRADTEPLTEVPVTLLKSHTRIQYFLAFDFLNFDEAGC